MLRALKVVQSLSASCGRWTHICVTPSLNSSVCLRAENLCSPSQPLILGPSLTSEAAQENEKIGQGWVWILGPRISLGEASGFSGLRFPREQWEASEVSFQSAFVCLSALRCLGEPPPLDLHALVFLKFTS